MAYKSKAKFKPNQTAPRVSMCALHSNQKRHSEMSIEPKENFSPKKAEENLTYLFLSIGHVDTILCSIVNKTKEKIQNNQRCVN
jgi:hypothetical protein